MISRLGDGGRRLQHPDRELNSPRRRSAPAPSDSAWRLNVTWQTPTAIDFRFGFEITLYVAAR
jgi:coenzyme PQQ precursor peptide PqqA